MSLINCEVNLILTGSWACAITNTKGPGRFAITDAKLYVPGCNFMLNEDDAKLLLQLKSGFRRTINWNKYQSGPKTYAQN